MLFVLDSGDDGINVGLLPLVGEELTDDDLFEGDFLPPSSEGVRDRLGGDLFGIKDLNLSVGVCNGGVTVGGGGVLENGDLDGDRDGIDVLFENTGAEVRDGGRGANPGGRASDWDMLFSVLTAFTALTCVDNGEGIRSITCDCSLEGAVSWECIGTDVNAGGDVTSYPRFDGFPTCSPSHSLVVEREISTGSLVLATETASSSSIEENCSDIRPLRPPPINRSTVGEIRPESS